MGAIAGALGALPGLGLDIFGALGAAGQQTWNNNAKVNVLNALNSFLQNSTGQVGALSNAFIPGTLAFAGNQTQQGSAMQTNAMNFLGSLMNQVNNGAFTNPTDQSRVPGLGDIQNASAGNFNMGTQGAQTVLNNLMNIGNNPQLQNIYSLAGALANGGGGQGLLSGAAGNLLGNGGQTGFGKSLQGSVSPLVGNQGYNPALNYATQFGQSMTQANPTVQQAQAVAGNILGSNPLLPMSQVSSMAVDQAAQQAKQQYDFMKQQLMNTTGITGPAVASGNYNELLNQLGDQSLQAQAQARDQALMNQQALQEQQFGQGINLFGQGTQANLGYTGQGLNALLQAAGQATGNLGTAGNLGLGVNAQNLANLLGGGQLQGESNQATLGALGALLGGLGTQNSMLGTNAGALSSLMGQNTGALGLQSNNLFNLQGLGLQSQQDQVNALLNSIGQYGNLGSTQVGEGLNATQIPMQYLSEWMSNLGNVYQNMTGLFGSGSSTPVNFYSNPANLLAGTQRANAGGPGSGGLT